MNKVGTAYILWLGGLVGLAGLHRLYNGKIWTGLLWLASGGVFGTLSIGGFLGNPAVYLLWLLSFGFFGLGQLVDLALIPKMVEAHNVRLSSLLNASASRETSWLGIQRLVEPSEGVSLMTQPSQSQTIVQLLHAAEEKSGRLSVTQGVMATGLGFSTIEALLQGMVRTGYVEIGNDPETGVVVYEFKEL